MEATITYTNLLLDEKRQAGDPTADRFLADKFSNPEAKLGFRSWMEALKSNMQLSAIVNQEQSPDGLNNLNLLKLSTQLPIWANPTLMKQGSAFFALHAEAILNLLGLLSLPYCYAAADGAMVLYQSDRMRNETEKRLFNTADFIWDVMAPGAFEKLGKGYASILKVRLGHAAARHYTLKSDSWKAQWGLPLNQEDMAGTNLSLSLIVIRGLRKLGYNIQYEDQTAFIHLWNVIGSLLGIDDDLLPETGKEAKALEALIRKRQFKPSPQGQQLTKSLTDYVSAAIKANGISSNEVLGLMRFLLGAEVSKILGFSAPELGLNKLRLLKALNLFKSLPDFRDERSAYHQAKLKFKLQRAPLVHSKHKSIAVVGST
jgi:hypothetical protein